jgi:hypothetical protein
MSTMLDLALVIVAVSSAVGYLAYRKIRARRNARDWSTGRAETCSSCPVVEIRNARLKRELPAR